MKNLLLSIVLTACLATGSHAHNGMLALYSDPGHVDCFKPIGTFQTAPVYLWYVRGQGPYLGQAVEFKLLRSSANTVFLSPTWTPTILKDLIMGTIETGISLVSQECFPAGDYNYIGMIPLFNIADPDTFTVRVVPDPQQVPEHAIVITLCLPLAPVYVVQGGTFVFNGPCYEPLDPWGTVAVKETTWGAIKELYR